MSKLKLLFVYIGILAIILVLGYGLYISSKNQQLNLPGQTFESQGQEHIDQGSTEHVAYNSNPPTSGPHWPQPANWGAYPTQLPDEQLVHNLEHGGIWISYKPGSIDQETINKLNDFAKRYTLIIVEPREQNETAITLAAWTHLQKLDQYDETAILRFIDAFYNKGPEKVM
jgi:hypothetical protein